MIDKKKAQTNQGDNMEGKDHYRRNAEILAWVASTFTILALVVLLALVYPGSGLPQIVLVICVTLIHSLHHPMKCELSDAIEYRAKLRYAQRLAAEYRRNASGVRMRQMARRTGSVSTREGCAK